MTQQAEILLPQAAAGEQRSRYARVAAALKQMIQSGEHAIGARLPPERELAARFAVSRQTVRAALRLLREERLIDSRQGAGSTIAAPARSQAFRLAANSIDDLVAYGAHMYTEIRSAALQRIDGRAAKRIGVAPGHDWLVVRGVARTRHRGLPVCWSRYYINDAFAAIKDLLPPQSGPIFLQIEEEFGVTITDVEQTISASALPRALAGDLKATPGETTIEVRRTYRTEDGTLAQISFHTHPATRFQQTIRMRRMA